MTSVETTTATPGKILGIVGFILAFIPYLQLPGLIVSIIGFNQAKKAGAPNGLAKAGIILSAIFLVLFVVILVVIFSVAAANPTPSA
ncbi:MULTISPECIES: hypothetical protein [Cryobacterium]|uniref:DUF4190 domain-containing protein n=1 Tax=Cryobacterium glucosi TaxID=1259175 RepID=A0ABY2IUA8_9MICO|nr:MULTISPECIES: hypothetical protein [Cryobacterium]MDY7527942.1 hypothetical protein [Cryobacterium sp. 10C2]MDY7556297.1 hypothetical protein [Cryobacterium sp. 10C3]MEB0004848.1 hypothetical protein [Cryobacterium sp. RTC2.1]MEB0203259.1 hypothetical protein [Cryobacterium sp. 5I3]MEB0285296.1 hypothetical protein [Cryobacterium sp. 10S3]